MRIGQIKSSTISTSEARQKIPTVDINKVAPNIGDIVYNIVDKNIYYGNGSQWIQLGDSDPEYQSYPLTEADVQRRSQNGLPNERYDIIICGAGTAGCLMTYRLAQKYPTAKILVLEAGKDDVQDDEVVRTPQDGPNPNLYSANPLITDDWGQLLRSQFAALGEGAFQIQQSQRSTTNDQYIPQQKVLGMARGFTLGGTSSINALVWNRGTKQGTYDKWETATGSADFGWSAMNESFKKIENRSQYTKYYGTPIPLWFPPNTPSLPPSAVFDPATQGDQGRINLTQPVLKGYITESVIETVASGFGGRSLQVRLNAEDPDNPSEYQSPAPQTFYSQANPDFQVFNPTNPNSFNPYPSSTPGLIYVPPNPAGITRGPEYAGQAAKVDGVPVVLGQANLKKFLEARCFAAPAFIYPLIYPDGNPMVPNNVTIKTKSYITKLIFDESIPLECVGVEYVENGWHVANVARAIRRDVKPWVTTFSNVDRSLCTEEQAKINQAVALSGGIKKAYSKTDVWLCLGAIDSPAVLQRSGVGPREVLENLNYSPVKCILDLPGVGRNVQDTCDIFYSGVQEVDYNTYLPSPLPASLIPSSYSRLFATADPTDPTDPINSASIGGAAIGCAVFSSSRLRLKSKSSLEKFDFDFLPMDLPTSAFVTSGNTLWGDILSLGQNNYSTVDFLNPKLSYINYDRSKLGQYLGNGTIEHITTFGCITEYWNAQSKGEVLITSGNVFDRPNYAPNMLSNENDLEAFENSFENNILPLFTKLEQKKRGPRGPFSYLFVIGSGGHATSTTQVQLSASVAASLFKPFAPAYHISQVDYDTPGGKMLGATLTIPAIPTSNQRPIVAWSGNTGNPLTSYVATVGPAYSIVPVGVYTLSSVRTSADLVVPVTRELPLDSVEFNDDNHRNFVRFAYDLGNQYFSDLVIQNLALNPLTTSPYVPNPIPGLPPINPGTRITVNYPNHGFVVGEMIKISGVSGPVDNIAASEFNDYHVVNAVLDANNFQIVLFWNRTARPGLPGAPPVNSPGALAVGIIGTGGSGIKVHTLKFDKYKFREFAYYAYFSGWHPASSCRMGPPDNTESVVDTRARVYNTLGLRVCDASILPTKPDANTMAPTYGIAQRLFELVSVEEYDSLL